MTGNTSFDALHAEMRRSERMARLYNAFMLGSFFLSVLCLYFDEIAFGLVAFGVALLVAFAAAYQYWTVFRVMEGYLLHQVHALQAVLNRAVVPVGTRVAERHEDDEAGLGDAH